MHIHNICKYITLKYSIQEDEMNYEELYSALQTTESDLQNGIRQAQKSGKQIVKDIESGDLRDAGKCLETLRNAIAAQQAAYDVLLSSLDGFDTKIYLESGEYAQNFLEACEQLGIDVHGDFPVYELFPYKVRIDVENQDIYLDKKKYPNIRPSWFAQTIKAGQEKLGKASFNVASFAEELAAAYDTAILKGKKRTGTPILLSVIYKQMVPMARSRKEYDMQSFVYDLARLYISGSNEIRDGRRFEMGTIKDNSKAIRILDQNGKEQYFGTVRFV